MVTPNGQHKSVAVLGGGSWGATLAHHLATNGHPVHLWEFVPEAAASLRTTRQLRTLPQLRLHDNVQVTNDIGEALRDQAVVVSVTPSHTVRATFEAAVRSLSSLISSATMRNPRPCEPAWAASMPALSASK